MSDRESTSLGADAARRLANTTKTPPQMGSITPRWLLRLLPWVCVEAGTYRVNRVRVVGGALERIETSVDAGQAELDPASLRAVPLLRNLDDATLARLAGMFESHHHPPGSLIVGQESAPDRFFILVKGKADAWIIGPTGGRRSLRLLRAGDYFGEARLLDEDAPTPNVESLTTAMTLSLTRAEFDSLLDLPGVRDLLSQGADAQATEMREAGAQVALATGTEPLVPATFVDYEDAPREYMLRAIQTTIRVDTKITDLYSKPYDQLEEQVRLVVQAARERQEWEMINNPEFGLVHNVAPGMRVPTRAGPPTPDDMDELLSVVWKEPAFFLAHPRAIAAFGRECTRRGVPPPTTNVYGCPFLTWRGVPLVPVDKLTVDYDNGIQKSNILLIRVGEERQGVVGLHQPDVGADPAGIAVRHRGVDDESSLVVRYNGVDQYGIAAYLLSLYFSLAILTDDAAGMLEDVEVGRYHDYERA